MSQSLFQSGAVISKWNKVISNWGKLLFTGRANSYFKVEQLFQSGAIISERDMTLIKRKTINPVKANKEAFRTVLNKGALKNISQNSKENTCARVSFLIRSHACLHPY